MYCLKNIRGRTRRHESDKRVEKFYEMDINRQIMIRTCLHKDLNTFTYIRGIVNSKNVARKHMCINFGPKKDNRIAS